METIGNRIKKWLDFNNLSQVQFGRDIGVSKGAVNQWVNNVNEPSPSHEKRMAMVYPELNIYWLWGKNEHLTRTNVLRPIEKSNVESILSENRFLKDKVETQQMLIEAYQEQIRMLSHPA